MWINFNLFRTKKKIFGILRVKKPQICFHFRAEVEWQKWNIWSNTVVMCTNDEVDFLIFLASYLVLNLPLFV